MNKNSNIVQLFVKAVQQHSNQVAFFENGQLTTYAQLLQQIQQTAANFSRKGIGKGDKVLVFIPMTTQLYVVVLGLMHMGAVPVFLDEWISLQRLKACLQTVHCKAIIAPRRLIFLSWFIRYLRPLKKIAVQNTTGEVNGQQQQMISVLPDDTALVTFTTGSTGIPKAANRTHRFLQAQYNALHPLLSNDCSVTLTLLPVVILLNLCLGKTNVLPGGKIRSGNKYFLNHLLRTIQLHRVESLIASPAITVALAKAHQEQNVDNIVRQVITGGGPLFPEGAITITKAFLAAETLVVFGSTEAEPISTLPMQSLANVSAETIQKQGLPIGSIHNAIQVAVVPSTESALPNMDNFSFECLKLPTSVSGELLVSGPHVLQQYLNNEVAQLQNKFWVDGLLWHRTGDEVILDESRNLYFLGRCKEVILWRGKKLYPLLFTWYLKQQVSIREAALLLQNGKLLLVLEQTDKIHIGAIKKYLQTVLPETGIFWMKHISKDKRHQTKVDYELLRAKLATDFLINDL